MKVRREYESKMWKGDIEVIDMKCVILAGGFGTRISEETHNKPKPMIKVGGWPLLVHIMHIYARSGFRDFLVACGYRGDVIKEYFANFKMYGSDTYFDLKNGEMRIGDSRTPDWTVGCIDTGQDTMTGGRIRRLKGIIGRERFMVTYGDGLANINMKELLDFHISEGRIATVTAVNPPARFGAIKTDGSKVSAFDEKSAIANNWINGGFFVFEPEIFDLIEGDATKLEKQPMDLLVERGELSAFKHQGFWQPMDTLREHTVLENFCTAGDPPWTIY